MPPATPLKVYVAATVTAALLCLGAWHGAAPVPAGPLLLLFAGLNAVALLYPLQLTRSRKVTVAATVQLAALLLFGPEAGMLAMGLSTLAANLTLRRRGRRDGWNVAFNAGQCMLGLALAAVAAAATALYLVNTLAVAGAVALQHGEHPLALWWEARRRDLLEAVALYLGGAVAGLTVGDHPWVLALLLVPILVVYQSLRRLAALTEQSIAVVEALVDVVELRGQHTAAHSRRVADLAEQLARALRLPAEQAGTVRLAARMHDLGKAGLPEAVLFKPGPLTPQERWLVNRHPETGYQILARFSELREVAALVRAQQERFDAAAPPPLGTQLVALPDAYDTLANERSPQAAASPARALALLEAEAGGRFDPRALRALAQVLAPAPATPIEVAAVPAAGLAVAVA